MQTNTKVQQLQKMQAKLASQPSATVAAFAAGTQATRTFYTNRPAPTPAAGPQQVQDQVTKSYIQANDVHLWRNSLSNDRILKYKIERTPIESENMDSKITVLDTSNNNPKPLIITPPLSNIACNISGLGALPKRTGDKPVTPFDHGFWMVVTRNVDLEFSQKNPELKYDIRMFFLRLVICLMRDLINMYENGEIMKDTKRKAVIIKAKQMALDLRKAAAQGKKVNMSVQPNDPDVKQRAYKEWIDGARVFFNKVAPQTQQDETMGEQNESEQGQVDEQQEGENESGKSEVTDAPQRNATVDTTALDYIDPAKKAIEDQLIEHWAGILGLDKDYIASKFENATSLILVQKVWIIPKGQTSAKLKAAYQLLEAEHIAKYGGIKDEEKMELMKQAGYIYQAVDVLDSAGRTSLKRAVAIQKEKEIQGIIRTMKEAGGMDMESEARFYQHLAEEKKKIENPFRKWSPRGSVVIPRIYRQHYANKGNDAPYGIRLMIDRTVRQLKKGKDSSFRPMTTSDEFEGAEDVEAYLNEFAGYGEGSEYAGMYHSHEEITNDNVGPNEGGEHHHPHHHHPDHHTDIAPTDNNVLYPPAPQHQQDQQQRNPHEVGTDDLRRDLAANLGEQQQQDTDPRGGKRRSSATDAAQATISGSSVATKKKKFS